MLRVVYMNTENFSRIILNGHLSDKIFLRCGIRQGYPMSGFLFNLAVHVLAGQIKTSQLLTGILLTENQEVRIIQYADDTVLFLSSEPHSVSGALFELIEFSTFSGLKLNVEKTACLPINVQAHRYNQENLGIKWVEQMKILRIVFSKNNEGLTQFNMEPRVLQIKQEIAQWNRRNLTPLGKITVIKSLLLSKLVHLFTSLPNPVSRSAPA